MTWRGAATRYIKYLLNDSSPVYPKSFVWNRRMPWFRALPEWRVELYVDSNLWSVVLAGYTRWYFAKEIGVVDCGDFVNVASQLHLHRPPVPPREHHVQGEIEGFVLISPAFAGREKDAILVRVLHLIAV